MGHFEIRTSNRGVPHPPGRANYVVETLFDGIHFILQCDKQKQMKNEYETYKTVKRPS